MNTLKFEVTLTFADQIESEDVSTIRINIEEALESWVASTGIAPDYTCTQHICVAPLADEVKDIPEVMHCPNCGSDDISADGFEPEGCYVPVECHNCGHEWADTYKYMGIEEVSRVQVL